MSIVPPVIVDDSGDLTVFLSQDAAEGYLEPWAPEAGIQTYDSEGRLLRIVPTGSRVRLVSSESEPLHADVLRGRLAAFFAALGESRTGLPRAWLDKATLQDLVEQVRMWSEIR